MLDDVLCLAQVFYTRFAFDSPRLGRNKLLLVMLGDLVVHQLDTVVALDSVLNVQEKLLMLFILRVNGATWFFAAATCARAPHQRRLTCPFLVNNSIAEALGRVCSLPVLLAVT